MCTRYPVVYSCGHTVYTEVACAETPNRFGTCTKGIEIAPKISNAWPCSSCLMLELDRKKGIAYDDGIVWE
ncbi:hypothetical protein F5B20DRAFT_583379 [Whalleya microplaca]|nr:hypothetical protein F5B20DRAFT_583379 [Whalleya microplaca]